MLSSLAFNQIILNLRKGKSDIDISFVKDDGIEGKISIVNNIMSIKQVKGGVSVDLPRDMFEKSIDSEVDIKDIKLTSYNTQGNISETTILYFYNNRNLYNKVFASINRDIKFLIKHLDGYDTAYYINGRVFLTQIDDGDYNLIETDLNHLSTYYSEPTIECFKTISRVKMGKFMAERVTEAKKHNKTFKNIKRGVLINNDTR